MPSEFALIEQLAKAQGLAREEVSLGIGDDAALLNIPEGFELVVSTDTLNAGIHFHADMSAKAIGHKALAVNLSDLAAMGATPMAVNLSLSLPEADEDWLNDFAKGFLSLAKQHNVQLTGGDTTQGYLSISVTAMGLVPKGQAIKRSGARPGDLIYVTGSLGDAGAALLAMQGELKLTGPQQQALMQRLELPEPRVAWGQLLLGLASACIDISDGLSADLGHILTKSGVGATIVAEQLPITDTLQSCFDLAGGYALPLQAGDDYELCFTIPDNQQQTLESLQSEMQAPIKYIGMIEKRPGLHIQMPDGSMETYEPKGYQHFQ